MKNQLSKFEVLETNNKDEKVHIVYKHLLTDPITMYPVYDWDVPDYVIAFDQSAEERARLGVIMKTLKEYENVILPKVYKQISQETIIRSDVIYPPLFCISRHYDRVYTSIDEALEKIGVEKEIISNGWFRRLMRSKVRCRYIIKYLLFTITEDINFYPKVKNIKRDLHYKG